jgi:glycine betaine/proline transport system permease protein
MSTATAPATPQRRADKEQQPFEVARRRHTAPKLLGVVVVWVVGWALLKGRQTLTIGGAELTDLSRWLNDFRDDVERARPGSFFLDTLIGGASDALDAVFTFLAELVSAPAFPRPVPEIGWLGVLAILVWVAYAAAGWRPALLVAVCTASFGVLGVWEDSLDLLIVTVMSVVICILVGIPIGIAMARRKAVSAVITPILDTMQTMPAFAYLTPLALFWGIGPAAAVVTTLIYALPPLVRITEHGLRSVPASTTEAAHSLGVSRGQLLRQVQLPLAKSTIVVGINQCTLAALSMATIAALINGPGLGGPVVKALQALDVGAAVVAGFAIVLLAIMLDRTTTAASVRVEQQARSGRSGTRLRRVMLGVGLVGVGVAVYASRTYLWAAEFPDGLDASRRLADRVNEATESVVGSIDGATEAIKDFVTYGLLNPMQSLLAESPWWLVLLAVLAIAFLLGGVRAAVPSAVCLLVILGTGLWHEAMVTLNMTLVATVMVMAVAVVVGVAMGRSRGTDLVLRPILDAFQTIPSFVYLVPALALFGTTRFMAIVAAVLYAVPVATKLVADGIRRVSPTTVEAATSVGSNRWQIITRVQLPMAREGLVLAANQGLLYVLSMVVIGGLVGGGGLGFLVVAGFSQAQLFGKGLAAAFAIVALGIMLDRITRSTAARYGRQ